MFVDSSNWINKNQVNQYLLRIKDCICKGNFKYEQNRQKNIKSLAQAGLLPSHIPGIIMTLTYMNYFNGPEAENDPQYPAGEYMFFGDNINGYEFYIKIKLEQQNKQDFSICIGFHIAEKAIVYAFKNK